MTVTIELTDDEVKQLKQYVRHRLSTIGMGLYMETYPDRVLGRLWDAIPQAGKEKP